MSEKKRPPVVKPPPTIIDESSQVPNFEPIFFLMFICLLVLFIVLGVK